MLLIPDIFSLSFHFIFFFNHILNQQFNNEGRAREFPMKIQSLWERGREERELSLPLTAGRKWGKDTANLI